MPFRMLLVAALAAALSGCRDLPGPVGIGADPADPDASGRSGRYRSITADTRDYKVVAPKPWGQSNEQVAPKAK